MTPHAPSRRDMLTGGLTALAGALITPPADASSASVTSVEHYYDQLIKVMRAGGSTVRARYDALAPIMNSAFDFAAMTQLAVGPAWNKATPDQQEAGQEEFARLMTADYASRIGPYAGETFTVEPEAQTRGGQEVVRTTLNAPSGATKIDYLMRGSRIVDIYLNGSASEVASRRWQFEALIRNTGFDGFVATLRENSKKLLAG